MTYQDLEFAIQDAQRFIDRTRPVLDAAAADSISESDLRIVRYLSLDVTRAMLTLRKRIEETPDPDGAFAIPSAVASEAVDLAGQ